MNASIRGQKRRKSRPQETCAVCGRTGNKGFVTRKGLRVCWAVPRCMERTLSEPPPPPPDPTAEWAAWERDLLQSLIIQKLRRGGWPP